MTEPQANGNVESNETPHVNRRQGSARFFRNRSLRVDVLFNAIHDRFPLILDKDSQLFIYHRGVYRRDPEFLNYIVSEFLGDRFQGSHVTNLEKYAKGRLYELSRLPLTLNLPLANFKNTFVNLRTLEPVRHSPDHLSSAQLQVNWEPDATCDRFLDWLSGRLVHPEQLEDLIESLSEMFDQSVIPLIAIFLFGESRSGKGTVERIMTALYGSEFSSAVDLHTLLSNRFAAAQLYGSRINCASDISAKHINDVSLLKRLFGGIDQIYVEHKGRNGFFMTNQSLNIFSANEVPTINDPGDALFGRFRVFKFGNSYRGTENPAIEVEIMNELPGIAALLARARHGYLAREVRIPQLESVRAEFKKDSSLVASWVAERCDIFTHSDGQPPSRDSYIPMEWVTTGTELRRSFNSWARSPNRPDMREGDFLSLLRNVDGVVEVRDAATSTRGFNVRVVKSSLLERGF